MKRAHPENGMDQIEQLKQITEFAGGYSELHMRDGKKAYYPKKDAEITDDVIKRHLDGSQPIGINMNVGDGKSHFAVFDFDDHDGTVDTESMRKRVGYVSAALAQQNMPHFTVRSGGGKGYHIWVAFKRASRADYVRTKMRNVLAESNGILAQSPWAHERFVPDDGNGKGMFHNTEKVWKKSPRPVRSNITVVEHHIELLPKDGDWPVIALPLALKSIVLTPTGYSDCGNVEFEEGGDLIVQPVNPRKTGPKAGQTKAEVDVDDAILAFAKARPGGGYREWVSAGFNIHGAFGEDGAQHWLAYSKETDGFESDKAVSDKWADICKKGANCGARPFWAFARAGADQWPCLSPPEISTFFDQQLGFRAGNLAQLIMHQ